MRSFTKGQIPPSFRRLLEDVNDNHFDLITVEFYPSGGYDTDDVDGAKIHPAVVTSTGELPPNIGGFIDERLDDVDNDFNGPPWDSVR